MQLGTEVYRQVDEMAGDYMDQEWKDGPGGRQVTKHTNGRNTCFADPRQRAARCHPESPCSRCVPDFLGT